MDDYFQVVWDSKYLLRTGVSGITIMDVLTRHQHKSNREEVFWSLEQDASGGLTTYISLKKKNTFLHVKNIRNRLILTLPKDK